MRGEVLREKRTVQPRTVQDDEEEHMGEELMKEEDEKNEGMMRRERRVHVSLMWRDKGAGVMF